MDAIWLLVLQPRAGSSKAAETQPGSLAEIKCARLVDNSGTRLNAAPDVAGTFRARLELRIGFGSGAGDAWGARPGRRAGTAPLARAGGADANTVALLGGSGGIEIGSA